MTEAELQAILERCLAKIGEDFGICDGYSAASDRNALFAEVQRLRKGLLRVASRGEHWSPGDLHANVADLLGLTLAELQQRMEGVG